MKADLRRFEGLVLQAYPDPLTHSDPWTIGAGHTGKNVYKGLCITIGQAEAFLDADVNIAITGCRTLPIDFDHIDPVRQDALINLCFNLGAAKLATFDTFLGYIKDEMWTSAALDLAGTAWAHQVGANRSSFVEYCITHGARPA